MELRAITYMYVEDGILHNKVVGIFTRDDLDEAMNDIRVGFGEGKSVKQDIYDESCDNYFLEYNDEQRSLFYSSNYIVGELRL